MTGIPQPEDIYRRTKEEGARRLERPLLEVVSTALAAGFDIVAGVVALGIVGASLVSRIGPRAGSRHRVARVRHRLRLPRRPVAASCSPRTSSSRSRDSTTGAAVPGSASGSSGSPRPCSTSSAAWS